MFKLIPFGVVILLLACSAIFESQEVDDRDFGPNIEPPQGSAVRAILDANKLHHINIYDKIEISDDGHITALFLGELDLVILPSQIGDLRYLKRLELQDNYLGSLPHEIGNLTELESLFINGNLLFELPVSMQNLNKLRELNFSNNNLDSLHQEYIILDPSLLLLLDNNQICKISDDAFAWVNNYSLNETWYESQRCHENRNQPSKCEELVVATGDCDEGFFGYAYNSRGRKCEKLAVMGCSYSTPFESLEECDNICRH